VCKYFISLNKSFKKVYFPTISAARSALCVTGMILKFQFSHNGSTDIKSVVPLVIISPKNVSTSKALYIISKHTGVLHRQTDH